MLGTRRIPYVLLASGVALLGAIVAVAAFWTRDRPLPAWSLSQRPRASGCYRIVELKASTYDLVGRLPVSEQPSAPPSLSRPHCYELTYDASNRLRRLEYRKGGRLATDEEFGVARIVIDYDNGFERRIYQNERGHPTADESGVYSVRLKRNDRGQRVSLFNYDRDGELAPDNRGVAQYLWALDDKGRRVRSIRLDAKGERISDKDGVFESHWEYDSQDRMVAWSSYGKDGQLREANDGIAQVRAEYGAHGFVSWIRRYGADGQLKAARDDGFAIIRESYDDYGRRLRREFLGADEQLVEDRSRGGAVVAFSWDNPGNLLETALFGTDGQRKRGKGGWAIARRKFDVLGNTVESRFLGPDEGLTAEIETGVAVTRREFDEYRSVTSESYLDHKEQPVRHKAHEAFAVRQVYDDRGNMIERHLLAADGFSPLEDKKGAVSYRWEYGEKDKLVKTVALDRRGRVVHEWREPIDRR